MKPTLSASQGSSGSTLSPSSYTPRSSQSAWRGSTMPRTTLAMTCPIMRPCIRFRSETRAEPTYLGFGYSSGERHSTGTNKPTAHLRVVSQKGSMVSRYGVVPAIPAARLGTTPIQPCQPTFLNPSRDQGSCGRLSAYTPPTNPPTTPLPCPRPSSLVPTTFPIPSETLPSGRPFHPPCTLH